MLIQKIVLNLILNLLKKIFSKLVKVCSVSKNILHSRARLELLSDNQPEYSTSHIQPTMKFSFGAKFSFALKL